MNAFAKRYAVTTKLSYFLTRTQKTITTQCNDKADLPERSCPVFSMQSIGFGILAAGVKRLILLHSLDVLHAGHVEY